MAYCLRRRAHIQRQISREKALDAPWTTDSPRDESLYHCLLPRENRHDRIRAPRRRWLE